VAQFPSFVGIFVLLAIGRIIYKLIVGDESGSTPTSLSHEGSSPVSDPNRLREQPLSLWRRAYRLVADRMFGRWIQTCEMEVDFVPKPHQFRIRCFCPRTVFYLDVLVPPHIALLLTGVSLFSPDSTEIDQWGLSYHETGERTRIRISLKRPTRVERIRLEFAGVGSEYFWEVQSRIDKSVYADETALFTALRDAQVEQFHSARTYALEYLTHCDSNPHIHLLLGRLHAHGVNTDDAKFHLTAAMALGLGDISLDRYRTIAGTESWISDEELSRLRKESAEWAIPPHHGVVTLVRHIEHTLGVHDWNVKRSVEVLEIRRAVAGRFMSSVGFNLDTRETLMFTRARWIPRNGSPRELPLEQFTLREDPSNNPQITTLNDKTGSWLLPDFEAGDILEWTFETIRPEGRPLEGEKGHAFIVSSPGHSFYPTLEGQVSIKWREPTAPCINVGPVVDTLSSSESFEEPWISRSVEIKKYLPRHAHSSPYHHYELNPVVTCATVNQDWSHVGQVLVSGSQGGLEPADEVPEPLASIVAAGNSTRDKLARAFYWARDNLNYAAIESALGNIGQALRAQAIVTAGVADCKDRSYLLYLVCRGLNLKAEYVFVSYKYGVTFASTPADQFDHILVRTYMDGQWVYMDATNSDGVFGSLSYRLQGMTGLACGKTCELVELPIDEPAFNRLELTETFDAFDSDWLCGTIFMRLTGNLARLTDEAWKVDSLYQRDDNRSAQNIMESYVPNIRVESHARIRETSDGSVFEVSGTHKRCQLVALGDLRMGTLSWSNPSLPTDRGHSVEHQDVFAFALPLTMHLQTIFNAEPASVLRDISPDEVYSGPIGSVVSKTHRDGDTIRLSRELTIRNKYVRNEELKTLPQFFEAVDRAMKVGLSFCGYTGAGTP
jgi:hypothetical protein